jgi:predicted lipid carrier protein YhbT
MDLVLATLFHQDLARRLCPHQHRRHLGLPQDLDITFIIIMAASTHTVQRRWVRSRLLLLSVQQLSL